MEANGTAEFFGISVSFQLHALCYGKSKLRQSRAIVSKKWSFHMHDIEQKPSQDDSTVKRTDGPRQEDRQVVHGAGTTPMMSEPERPRQPFAMRSLIAGGIALLVLAVIFSAVLLRGRPTSQPSPTATPASSSAGSAQQVVSITITGGVAYTGADGSVYALRTDNGTMLWRSRIEGAVGYQPVVVDGVVYVAASTDSTATLYALRASDGIQLWHSTSNGPVASWLANGGVSIGPAISAPVVANGVVYVGLQGDKVLALRAGNGTLLWQFSDHMIGLLSPQLVDGVVYVTAANDEQPGNVYALRASDGRLLWHYKASASLNSTSTTVIDGVAYIRSQDGMLMAFHTSDGRQLWQRALGSGNLGTLWEPLQAFNGVLYVATTTMSAPTASTSSPGLLPQALAIGSLVWGNFHAAPAEQTIPYKEGVSALYALRASDGAMLWHFTMNYGKNGIVGWLSVEEGVIYASVEDTSTPGTSQGHIYALRSTTGSVLWHYDDKNTSPSGAVLANGIIYASAYSQDSNGVVYALRARDGSMLWRYSMGLAVYDAPVLYGATVYVGTADGSVYALWADTGAVEWHHSA